MAHSKVFRRCAYGLISLAAAALVFCACTDVPEYCGDGQSSYDFKNQFCFGGTAYWKCGGKTYDPIHYQCNDKGQIVAKTTDTTPTVTPPVTPPVTPATYAVTVKSAGTGAIGGGSYAAGASVTIYAGTPPSGQQFKNWTSASSGVGFVNANNATTTFTMPSNAVTVTANFEAATVTPPVTPTTYAVTVTSAGSGSSGGGNYAAGATVTIKAGTAPSGQRFKNWTTASNGVTFVNANSATTTFTMPLNAVVVTAVFEQVVFAVTVSAGAGATGGGDYEEGAMVTISAGTAPSGQKFKNWTTASGDVTFANSTSATTTFTMPKNAVTVTANFEAKPVAPPNVSYGTLNDSRDNQTYNTVKIGSQVWMAENLNYATTSGSWCWNCGTYGRLYDWATANTACPSGWHLPSQGEWDDLNDYAGGRLIAGKKLKATSGWCDYQPSWKCADATDEFGFSALPGGDVMPSTEWDDFVSQGAFGDWWTATEIVCTGNVPCARTADMYYHRDDVYIGGDSLDKGKSVRCVQD